MDLWNVDLSTPFSYVGDTLFNSATIKTMIDNGWYLNNYYIGAPDGGSLYDFPQTNNLDFLIMKILSIFSHDYAFVMNSYFLLTFPLITLTSMLVFRQLKIPCVISIFASVLFAFIPYHFFRGEPHLFLGSYFMVPLMVLVLLWVLAGEVSLLRRDEAGKMKLNLRDGKVIASLVICLLVSSTYVYFPFFSCFFLLVAGLVRGIGQKDKFALGTAILLVLVIALGILINLSPVLIYQLQNGSNPMTASRSPMESEFYGLKIIQMLMPIQGHRIPQLAYIAQYYLTTAPLANHSTSSLGIIASLGFLSLLGLVFYMLSSGGLLRQAKNGTEYLGGLGILNLSAVLLGTVAGFGAVFAYLISPQIRCYDRISIYIAFFSITAIAILLSMAWRKFAGSGVRKLIFCSLIAALLLAGIFDQTSISYTVSSAVKNEYMSDDKFVKAIESMEPQDAMILQLPYWPFPEYGNKNDAIDYSLFKGYLHSTSLRWSYGAMKGREEDNWQQMVASMPAAEMVKTASLSGFSGIYIDGYAYADRGAALVADLSGLLGVRPLISDDQRLYFLDMTPYNEKLKGNYTAEAWAYESEMALHPVHYRWTEGFSGMEGDSGNNWRWCSRQGELIITNPSGLARNVTIQMGFRTGYSDPSVMEIAGDTFDDKITAGDSPVNYIRTLSLKPGETVIRMNSTARKIIAPGDPRDLVFAVINFQSTEAD